jgi:hypothetical protein
MTSEQISKLAQLVRDLSSRDQYVSQSLSPLPATGKKRRIWPGKGIYTKKKGFMADAAVPKHNHADHQSKPRESAYMRSRNPEQGFDLRRNDDPLVPKHAHKRDGDHKGRKSKSSKADSGFGIKALEPVPGTVAVLSQHNTSGEFKITKQTVKDARTVLITSACVETSSGNVCEISARDVGPVAKRAEKEILVLYGKTTDSKRTRACAKLVMKTLDTTADNLQGRHRTVAKREISLILYNIMSFLNDKDEAKHVKNKRVTKSDVKKVQHDYDAR